MGRELWGLLSARPGRKLASTGPTGEPAIHLSKTMLWSKFLGMSEAQKSLVGWQSVTLP